MVGSRIRTGGLRGKVGKEYGRIEDVDGMMARNRKSSPYISGCGPSCMFFLICLAAMVDAATNYKSQSNFYVWGGNERGCLGANSNEKKFATPTLLDASSPTGFYQGLNIIKVRVMSSCCL